MFDSFGDFLAMGGYGSFVWLSYATALGLMLFLAAQSLLVWKRRRQVLHSLQESRMRHRRADPARASTDPVATDPGRTESESA